MEERDDQCAITPGARLQRYGHAVSQLVYGHTQYDCQTGLQFEPSGRQIVGLFGQHNDNGSRVGWSARDSQLPVDSTAAFGLASGQRTVGFMSLLVTGRSSSVIGFEFSDVIGVLLAIARDEWRFAALFGRRVLWAVVGFAVIGRLFRRTDRWQVNQWALRVPALPSTDCLSIKPILMVSNSHIVH